MDTRYYIRHGDKTTAGGIVVEGTRGRPTTHCAYGLGVAHEGDAVACPVCHSTGKIVSTGPRPQTTGAEGRKIALSDDLCVCGCNPPPRLVASQSTMFVKIGDLPDNDVDQRALATPIGKADTPVADAEVERCESR